jgi:hypothetical protein
MPMIKYACKCGYERNKFYSNKNKVLDNIDCEKCGETVQRTLSSPSQRSKIVVDNGVQAKAVELDRQIVEIIEDREKVDLKKRGDAILENLK